MTPDASSYPIPTIAQLALSMYASGKRVERLPVVTEYTGHVEITRNERWNIVPGLVSPYLPHTYETLTIGGDL